MSDIQTAADHWNSASQDVPYYKQFDPLNVLRSHDFASDISGCDFGTFGNQTESQQANFSAYLALLGDDYQRQMAVNWFQTLGISNVFRPALVTDSHPIDSLPVGATVTLPAHPEVTFTKVAEGVKVETAQTGTVHRSFGAWFLAEWHRLTHGIKL